MAAAKPADTSPAPGVQLYVHFPFCRSKCAYCALYSRTGDTESFRKEYSRAAASAIERAGFVPETVYFGGGTPAVSFPEIAAAPLAEMDISEFSMEINPSDFTPSLPDRLLACGVDRVSVGVQSFDDTVLSSMGRTHTAAQAEDAVRALRAAGFSNIGMDLIAGWPGMPRDAWRLTVEKAIALSPAHCSVYSLIRERGTPLDIRLSNAGARPDPGEALDRVAEAGAMLGKAGYERYEVSNWAKPGFKCRHNASVWDGADYLGIGAGAFSRMGGMRWRTAPDPEAFVKAVSRGAEPPRTEEESPDALEDAVSREIFALRTSAGLDVANAVRRRPVLKCVEGKWRDCLEYAVSRGLLAKTSSGAFAPTPRGFEVVDSILAGLV